MVVLMTCRGFVDDDEKRQVSWDLLLLNDKLS